MLISLLLTIAGVSTNHLATSIVWEGPSVSFVENGITHKCGAVISSEYYFQKNNAFMSITADYVFYNGFELNAVGCA